MAEPTLPLHPIGPIVSSADAQLWAEASAVRDAAQNYMNTMRNMAVGAFEQEKRRGYAEGLELARQEQTKLIANTRVKLEALYRRAEDELPSLVLECVKKILGSFDPGDILLRTVMQGIASYRDPSTLCLKVHPSQHTNLKSRLDQTSDLHPVLKSIMIEADPAVGVDRCLLVSEAGVVDLGIEAQLAALGAGLQIASQA